MFIQDLCFLRFSQCLGKKGYSEKILQIENICPFCHYLEGRSNSCQNEKKKLWQTLTQIESLNLFIQNEKYSVVKISVT